MAEMPAIELSENELEELREFASILRVLPKEDRAILLSNANAFKLRGDIERGRSAADHRGRRAEKGRRGPEDGE